MPLHLNNMTDELAPLMQGKQETLRFNGPMSRSEFAELVKAIPDLPSLKLLHLQQAYLQSSDVKALSSALSTRTDLQELGLHKSPITDEDAILLADALKPHKDFRALQISYCELQDEGMNALVDVIARSPNFRSLTASGNKWNQSTHDKLAVALSDKSDLATLSLWRDEKPPLDEHILEKSLLQNPHPNLVTTTGIHSHAIGALTSRNLAARVDAGRFLDALNASGDSYAKRVNLQVLEPVVSSSRGISHTIGFNVVKDFDIVDAIFKTQTRRTALIDFSRNEGKLAAFDDFLKQMPKLEAGIKPSIDALFKEDAQGFSPLENPITWQNHPNLLTELAQENGLSTANRQRTTSRGTHLLDAALSYLPTESVIDQIVPVGLRIGREELLTGEGKPTKLLDIIFSKGETTQLFTLSNWAGKSKNEVKSLVMALPEDMKPTVPPLLGLFQQLDAARPSTSRGR